MEPGDRAAAPTANARTSRIGRPASDRSQVSPPSSDLNTPSAVAIRHVPHALPSLGISATPTTPAATPSHGRHVRPPSRLRYAPSMPPANIDSSSLASSARTAHVACTHGGLAHRTVQLIPESLLVFSAPLVAAYTIEPSRGWKRTAQWAASRS